MATAEQYAKWIIANQDKKGTPEFEIVKKAYILSRATPAAPAPQAAPIGDTGFIDMVKRGVVRGTKQAGSLLGDVLPAMVAQGIGADEYAAKQMGEAQQTQEDIAQNYAARYGQLEDVQGIGDVLPFVAETMAEQVPLMATAIIPGVGGAALGARAVAGQAAKKLLAAEAAKTVAKGQLTGGAIGTYLGSYALNAPEIFQNIYQETGQLEPGAAALAGSVSAALDAIIPARILGSFTPKEKLGIVESILERSGMKKGVLRKAISEATTAAPIEGLTEAGQEAISITAEKFVQENAPLWDSDDFKRLVEAGVRGAVGGGGISAVTGGLSGYVDSSRDARTQLDEEDKYRQDRQAARVENAEQDIADVMATRPKAEGKQPLVQETFPGMEVGPHTALLQDPAAQERAELKNLLLEDDKIPGTLKPQVRKGIENYLDGKGPKPAAPDKKKRMPTKQVEMFDDQYKVVRPLGAREAMFAPDRVPLKVAEWDDRVWNSLGIGPSAAIRKDESLKTLDLTKPEDAAKLNARFTDLLNNKAVSQTAVQRVPLLMDYIQPATTQKPTQTQTPSPQSEMFPLVPAGPVDRYAPAPFLSTPEGDVVTPPQYKEYEAQQLQKQAALKDMPGEDVIQPRQEIDAARARVDLGDMFPAALTESNDAIAVADQLGVAKNSGLYKRLTSSPDKLTVDNPQVQQDFADYAKRVKSSNPKVAENITNWLRGIGRDNAQGQATKPITLTPKLFDALGVSKNSSVRSGVGDITGSNLSDPEVVKRLLQAPDVSRAAKMKLMGMADGAPKSQMTFADVGLFDKKKPAVTPPSTEKPAKPTKAVKPEPVEQEMVEQGDDAALAAFEQETVVDEPPPGSVGAVEESLAQRDAEVKLEQGTPEDLWDDFGPEGVKWVDLNDDQQNAWTKWLRRHPPSQKAALEAAGFDAEDYVAAGQQEAAMAETTEQEKQRVRNLKAKKKRERLTDEEEAILNAWRVRDAAERKLNETVAEKANSVIERKFRSEDYVVDLTPNLEEGAVGTKQEQVRYITDQLLQLVSEVTGLERSQKNPEFIRRLASVAESELNRLESSARVVSDRAKGLPITYDLALRAHIIHRMGALINAYRVAVAESNREISRQSTQITKAMRVAQGVINHKSVTPDMRNLAKTIAEFKPSLAELRAKGRRQPLQFISLDTLAVPQTLQLDTVSLDEAGVDTYYSKTKPVGNPLSDAVRAAVQKGDLRTAVNEMISITADPVAKKVLEKISRLGLKTKIVVGEVPEFGSYDPKTDTITLDPNNGMDDQVLLHELVHAAISHVLVNPDVKLTKDMLQFFEGIKNQMGSAYGGTNIQEFTAELVSNPEFQALLKTIKAPRGGNLFQRIIQAIAEFFGFRKGGTAFDKGLKFVMDAIDISKDVQANPADRLFFGGRDNLDSVVMGAAKQMPLLAGNAVEDTKNYLSNLPQDAKVAAFGFLRLDNINAMYGDVLTGIKDLMNALELRIGNEERQIKGVNDNYTRFVAVQQKYPDAMKHLNRLANNARREELELYTWVDYVDPKTNMPVTKAFLEADDAKAFIQQELTPGKIPYKLEEFTPSPAQKAQYGRYRTELRNLPGAVEDTYKTIRAAYRQALNEYEHFLIGSVDPSLAAELKAQFETRRRVPGYIPFMRWGTKWLEFMDPKTGEMVKKAFESERERQQFINKELRPRRLEYREYERLEETRFDPGTIPPTQFITKVMADLARKGVSKEAQNSVYQAYLELFPAQSIAKQFMKAEGTPGMEEDIVRGYGDTMIKWVRKIGNSRFNPLIDHAMKKIENEAVADGDPTVGAAAQNILKQAEFFHNPTFGPLVHKLTAFSYFEYIAGSISSAVINLSTLPMFTFPILLGKFGKTVGYNKTNRIMLEAMKANINGMEKNPRYTKLYQTLMDHAQLEHTMAREVLEGRRTSTDEFTGAWPKVLSLISLPFSMAERANRGVTAIAAYELALKSGMQEDKAIGYALQTVKDINTSGIAATAPRWMQSDIGRVALTFKSFPWNSAFIMAKTFADAFRKLPPDQKHIGREARRQLLGIYGMAMAFTGVAGMPFMGAVSTLADMIAALLGDDDEPFDLKTEMRLFVGDLVYKGGVNAVTNLEISNRVSIANDLIFRDDPKGIEEHGYALMAMQQLFGPMGSYVTGVERGINAWSMGEPGRAVEAIMPKFVRDGLKSVRFAGEGATTLKGDPIVEDVSEWNLAMQAIGFGPADLSLAYESIAMRSQFETKLEKRKQNLVRKLDMALTAGDTETTREAMVEIQRFNRAHPGFAITMETLQRSRRGRLAAKQYMISGVAHNRQLLPEIQEEMAFE